MPRCEHDDGADAELERALALLRRRFPSPPRERRDRDRALAVLLRKGYDTELRSTRWPRTRETGAQRGDGVALASAPSL